MVTSIFVWEMANGPNVGHASMDICGEAVRAYISWWPTEGDGFDGLAKSIHSSGLSHSIRSDKKKDRAPDWCSKPIKDLDESAIARWWETRAAHSRLQSGEEAAKSGKYDFISSNCATTVFRALMIGASSERRHQLERALFLSRCIGNLSAEQRLITRTFSKIVGNVGTLRPIIRAAVETTVGSVQRMSPFSAIISPPDIRNIVSKVWGD